MRKLHKSTRIKTYSDAEVATFFGLGFAVVGIIISLIFEIFAK